MKKDSLTEPTKGYLDLSNHPLPPEQAIGDGDESDGYEPSFAPDQEERQDPEEDNRQTEAQDTISLYQKVSNKRATSLWAYGPVPSPVTASHPEGPAQDPNVQAPLPSTA